MRRGAMFLVVAFALGPLIPAPALADNTTVANAEPLMVGQVVQGGQRQLCSQLQGRGFWGNIF